jgi:radical SAM-linked protein
MTTIRSRRIDFLDRMDAKKRLPIAPLEADERGEPGQPRTPRQGGPGKPPTAPRYRFRFEKIGPVALLGHLDLVREIPRSFRRAGVPLAYTSGFHPKPDMTFAPALSLGVMSLDEYVDMRIDAELDRAALAAIIERMNRTAPSGLVFRDAVRLGAEDAAITKVISGARYVLAFAKHALEGAAKHDPAGELARRCAEAMAAETLPIRRDIEGIGKLVDVRAYLTRAALGGAEAKLVARAGLIGDLTLLDVDVTILGSGAVKTSELAAVLAGDGQVAPPHRAVRAELFGRQGDARYSPLDLERARRPRSQTPSLDATPS